MNSITYFIFTVQMYHAVVICKADKIIYGMSEKESFKISLDEAVRYLNNNLSNTFIRVNSYQGLQQIIETGQTLTSVLQQHSQDDVFLFTDLNNQQNGIIREAIDFQSRNTANTNKVYLDSLLGSGSKVKDLNQETDALSTYLNKLLLPKDGLSVAVDNSQLGHEAFVQFIQRCNENGREIVGHYILKGEVTEESILALHFHRSNILFSSVEHDTFLRMINMTEKMGLTPFIENLKMFATKRSVTGITGICYKPTYIYFMADYQKPSSNATYIIKTLNGCRTSGNGTEHSTCFSRNDENLVKQLDLSTNTWKTAGKSDQQAQTLPTSANDIASKPIITASIAGNTPPWAMYVDLEKTLSDKGVCGRNGMKGIRLNGSKAIEICAHGFAIDIFQLLRKKLNFDYRIIVSRDGNYGSYDKETNTSSGMVREIVEKKSDIALDLIVNTPRSHVLWFSKSYAISCIGLMYVKGGFNSSGIFRPFDLNLWIGFLGSVVCVIIFIWVLERSSPYGCHKTNQRIICDDARTFNIVDSANYVWGTYFTGEIIVEKPRSFGSRVTIIVISIVAVVIIASYSGNLITYLLVVDEMPPINGLRDERVIGQNPTIIAGTPYGSFVNGYLQEHPDPRFRAFQRRLKFCKYEDCVQSLKKRELDALLYEYHTLKYMSDNDKDCSLKTIRLHKDSGVSIASLRAWTWKRRVDTAVSHMMRSGEVDYVLQKWIGKGSCKSSKTFYAIDILKLKNLFVILSISVLIASFILVIEVLWKKVVLKCNNKLC